MSRIRYLFCFAVFLLNSFLPGDAKGQKQLLLLKGEKVLLRLYPGDEITFSLKGNSGKIRSYINNLSDTAILAHDTVVPFYKIDRIYFDQKNFANVVGGLLVVAGAGYFLIDQINVVLVHGEKAHLENRVTIPSAILVGTGIPLLMMKKKYRPVGRKYRLRTVDKGSGFYRPDLRNSMSD